jgi:hypothetical protein
MRYFDDIAVETVVGDYFSLCVSYVGNRDLWGICERKDPDILVAIAGRIAADSPEWEAARAWTGTGGLAAKLVMKRYLERGEAGLTDFNGAFVIIIHDGRKKRIYLITDRTGSHPCFLHSRSAVFCSHQDILASSTDGGGTIDYISVAEFIKTGKLTHPHTYYSDIQAAEYGAIYSVAVQPDGTASVDKKRSFNFDFRIDHSRSEWDVAAELKESFKKAIGRRTLPLFGQSAVSLSGGLDSRAIVGALPDPNRVWSFSFFNKENREFSIARKVAAAAGMKLIPMKRSFDHYGDAAEAGLRIAGGMGDFASNHYLGFREPLRCEGVDNILTGFYCDYLFKGLILDKRINKWLRREQFSDFDYERYMPFFPLGTDYDDAVMARLSGLFPPTLRSDTSPAARLEIERRRIFPLSYEPDNMETLVPLRVLGWYLPTIDNDLIDTYLGIPPSMKLNTSMYAKMVTLLCGRKLTSIVNINTGARVNATWVENMIMTNLGSLRRKIFQRSDSGIETEESWPNWMYYFAKSGKIRSFRDRENAIFNDVLARVSALDLTHFQFDNLSDPQLKLWLRLLSIKLWLEHRITPPPTGVASR